MQHLEPAMASKSDGRPESALVFRAIRDKLVEYNESLVRKLVEERETARLEQEREEEEKEQGLKRAKETEDSLEITTDQELVAPSTIMEDDGGFKKRRLTIEANNSEAKDLKLLKSERDDAVSRLSVESEMPYRVVRTSMPPSTTRREETKLESNTRQQPVLLASTSDRSVSNGVVDGEPLVSTLKSGIHSIDSNNAKFERKLRESVRLHREITKHNVSVTRKRQLPRLPTPARHQSHWDFLLDEMKWMATDFAQERNWKRVLQHRLAANVIRARTAESTRQEQRDRQIARGIALQIAAFWRTMERIAARSRVRLETTSGDRSNHSELEPMADDLVLENDSKVGKSDDVDANEGVVALKYHTIEVESSKGSGKGVKKDEFTSAKAHMSYIVSAGKRARSAMTSSSSHCDSDKSSIWSLREASFRELQSRCSALKANGGPTLLLAAFQLLALRWMLDLYSSGLNMFLNDQLGMGKAATIVAFLRLLEYFPSHEEQDCSETATIPGSVYLSNARGPHLIIVSEEELHKWRYYLRVWHPNERIQLYDGHGSSPSYRERLQREWKVKSRTLEQKEDNNFLLASCTDDDDELDEDECVEPVYCVLCSVDVFVKEQETFIAFPNWQMVVVENEHGGLFDDVECVVALQQLRQQQRRILCNGQSIENWKSAAVRLQYAEFLVREAPGSDASTSNSQHRVEMWPVWELQVERASVARVMQLYGKSSSVRTSLWKASSQQEDTPQSMNALLLALFCLSLRRVRSEVESELGKIEEISLSCQLSLSQKTQYRNALSGFTATLDGTSNREESLSVWLKLLLRLREICNCVDLVNDMDKLGYADIRLLTSCSAKLEALEPLLRRLVVQECKKVVIYCQFNAMLPILELFMSLLDINYVRVTGSTAMQRRALCHFADRPVVRVALVSTRLSINGKRAVSVFGSEVIIVVDGDWNATCDAKLRASWAKMAVGGADTLPIYRLHCENTIEASLLRVGASLTEKVFGELSPQELLAVPSDMTLTMAIEKPSWWSSSATSSGGNGLTGTSGVSKLAEMAERMEKELKYCGDATELEAPLIVHNVDLDAEEHLLLANTDELTPVEWYAVNYVHSVNDQKQHFEGNSIEKTFQDEDNAWNESNTSTQSNVQSFEHLATLEANRQWQEGDAATQLFFNLEFHSNDEIDEMALEKFFMQMRLDGMETHFDVYKPPVLPETLNSQRMKRLPSVTGSNTDNEMVFRVTYRVPAPLPVPLGKSNLENTVGDPTKLTKSSKKQRSSSTTRAGLSTGSLASGGSSGVKRKLESQLGDLKPGSQKTQGVDLEGIPVPDVSEFADDDFWGDSNLDALDSAEWDDPALLSGILGGTGAASSSTIAGAAGMSGSGADADKSGTQKSSKKSKSGTGRSRKSSISDSGREAWSLHDDIVLKKLFELYGANWTLIAQVLNSWTGISRFVCKKRTPRQCYDRYGKIISGSITMPLTSTTKESKSNSSLKAQRAAAANVAAAQLTPAVLDARLGLPSDEVLLTFSEHESLPGLPPPSIVSAPNLVEMTLAYRKQMNVENASKKTPLNGADELKSIKTSFDAIIQCMKHKTSPPRIPLPIGGNSASSELGTKASLTAASFSPVTSVQSTAIKTTSPSASFSPNKTIVVPSPHKSHMDMISLLPSAVLGPDDVIKRSKEAAVVAVQAAAAVASVGREGSPLSANGDVILGAGSGFGASVSASMPRRSHAASLTNDLNSVSVISAVPNPSAAWTANVVPANGLPGSEPPRTPMPVTTSTLLHVLDRMPEIKNKIQTILNRTDCSESQKVAMIARLLSNTNAIANPNAASPHSNAVLSALTSDASMLLETGPTLSMSAAVSSPNVATSAPPGSFPPSSSKS